MMQQEQPAYPPQQPPAYPPPAAGYQPPPPVYQPTHTVIQPPPPGYVASNVVAPAPSTVVITHPGFRGFKDPCPHCGGPRKERVTLLGFLLLILLFPFGIICCLMMTETRCQLCRRT